MNVQLPPVLDSESLEGAERERANTLITEIITTFTTSLEAGMAETGVATSAEKLKALRAAVTERDGEIGRLAFTDAMRLVQWSIERNLLRRPCAI